MSFSGLARRLKIDGTLSFAGGEVGVDGLLPFVGGGFVSGGECGDVVIAFGGEGGAGVEDVDRGCG